MQLHISLLNGSQVKTDLFIQGQGMPLIRPKLVKVTHEQYMENCLHNILDLIVFMCINSGGNLRIFWNFF